MPQSRRIAACGASAGLGEEVEHLAGGLRIGIGEVEGLAVEPGLVGDVVDRGGDEVDRDDVDLAAFDADRRQPGGQHPPRPLEQLEEVVGPVDLVDLAGARVADDDARPVDPPGPRALLAHDPLGLVLGSEVGMGVEPSASSNMSSRHSPLVEPGGGDRADLVEAARLDRAGQFDGVAGALDVGDLLDFGVGGHVVDRRQVEEVVDLAAQGEQVLLGDSRAPAERGRRRSARPAPRRLPSRFAAPPAGPATRPGPARRSCPRAARVAATRLRPMKPVAPVTK